MNPRFLLALALLFFTSVVPVRAQNADASGPSGVIRGQVIDRDARIPLPGANVVLAESDPLIGTITDPDGRFVLERVPLGRHDVVVRFVG